MNLEGCDVPGDAHCKLDYLTDRLERKEFARKLADAGLRISALSCHGNPLHPDRTLGKSHDEGNPRRRHSTVQFV